ncbi:MAG: hypothetical protein AB1635_03130 [Acidobacteriota bacterium]
MLRPLLLFLLVLLVLRAAWRLLEGVVRGASGMPAGAARRPPEPVKMVQDPVCGTFVVPSRAVSLARAGQTLYFCSDTCRDQYAKRGSNQ